MYQVTQVYLTFLSTLPANGNEYASSCGCEQIWKKYYGHRKHFEIYNHEPIYAQSEPMSFVECVTTHNATIWARDNSPPQVLTAVA